MRTVLSLLHSKSLKNIVLQAQAHQQRLKARRAGAMVSHYCLMFEYVFCDSHFGMNVYSQADKTNNDDGGHGRTRVCKAIGKENKVCDMVDYIKLF